MEGADRKSRDLRPGFRTLLFPKRLLGLFLFLFCLLIRSEMALAFRVDLSGDWTIRVDGRPPVTASPSGPMGGFAPGLQGQLSIRYERSFRISESLTNESAYLVLPSNWANLQVDWNGVRLLDETSVGSAPGRLFEKRIISIPKGVLSGDNQISIFAQGHALRSGFRSGEIFLSDESSPLLVHHWRNALANDVHVVFIVLALVIGLIAFRINRVGGTAANAVRALALTGIGLIPHHLLATDFYRLVGASSDGPFKFQMVCQVAAWLNFVLFISRIASFRSPWLERLRSLWERSSWSGWVLLTLACALLFLPMSIFMVFVLPVFLLLSLASLVMTFTLRRSTYGTLFFLGTLLCMTSLASDVVFGNVYLLGYGTALFSIVGAAFLSANYHSSYSQAQVFGEIVSRSLPGSVHNRIRNLVADGRPLAEMRNAVSGCSVLAVVLVDICDWGKMNDIEQSKIPVGLLRQARSSAFAHFERVLAQHGFDLIKTTGDNMTFAGGLFDSRENTELFLSSKTLTAVRDLLAEVDPINGDLRRLNLPMVKVKISATMGLCDYGLELYNERVQFDLQGHPVNVVYRIESAMDSSFYEKFGKNVALVSGSVVHPCEDLNLRKRFSEDYAFSDKHGMAYECYVGRQYDRELRVEEFAQALYGLYGHLGPSLSSQPQVEKTPRAPLARTGNAANNDLARSEASVENYLRCQRVAKRQKLYVNDGLFVKIERGQETIPGRALDISGKGVAIAVSRDADCRLSVGERVALQFNIEQQNLNVVATVVNEFELLSDGLEYYKYGLQFVQPERKAAERAARRFPTLDTAAPYVVTKDPLDHRRTVRFRCIDISSSGLGLVTSADESSLLPGLQLEFTVGVPGEASLDILGEIRYVRTLDDGSLIHVGVRLLGDLDDFKSAAGAYLVAEGQGKLSFREARLAGFLLGGVRKLIRVRYPDCPEEWEQVRTLRRSLVRSDGDKGAELPVVDGFDDHSRQIVCKVGDRVVACSRIVFNSGEERRIEHLSYGAKIPEWILESKFVECSRLIVHPEFRGDDVLWAMMEEIGRVTLTSGHRYIVQSCAEALFPLYARFGFESLSTFEEAGSQWILGSLDVESGVAGKVSAGLGWALVLSNLSETMKRRHCYRLAPLDQARTKILDTTRPVVLARYKKYREKIQGRSSPDGAGGQSRLGGRTADSGKS